MLQRFGAYCVRIERTLLPATSAYVRRTIAGGFMRWSSYSRVFKEARIKNRGTAIELARIHEQGVNVALDAVS